MRSYIDEIYSDMLLHDGQKGMKWGKRRYRNYDGTLTPAGRERYGVGPAKTVASAAQKTTRAMRKAKKEIAKKASAKAAEKRAKEATEESKRAAEEAKKEREALEKARAAAAAEEDRKKKDPNSPESIAQRKFNLEASRLANDELSAKIQRIELERKYSNLVNPAKPPKKSIVEKVNNFLDSVKKITATGNDVRKMVEDFKALNSPDPDKKRIAELEKQDKIDRLIYGMETRARTRKKWADDDDDTSAKKTEKKEAEGSSSKTNDSSNSVTYTGPISYPLLNAPKKNKKRK